MGWNMKPIRHPHVITDLERSKVKRERVAELQGADTEEEREAILEKHTIECIDPEEYTLHIIAGCSLCTSHERRELRPHDVETG